jgi:hypothetical protein
MWHVSLAQRALSRPTDSQDHDFRVEDLENDAIGSTAAGFERNFSKRSLECVSFSGFGKRLWVRLNPSDSTAKSQIPSNRTLH